MLVVVRRWAHGLDTNWIIDVTATRVITLNNSNNVAALAVDRDELGPVNSASTNSIEIAQVLVRALSLASCALPMPGAHTLVAFIVALVKVMKRLALSVSCGEDNSNQVRSENMGRRR